MTSDLRSCCQQAVIDGLDAAEHFPVCGARAEDPQPEALFDLTRLAAHIPCLDAAAADETAPARVRSRAAAMAQAARSAVGIAGGDPTRNDHPGRGRTETPDVAHP